MTTNAPTFGKKIVIMSVIGAALVMFVTSFVYRMENPNLFVKVEQQHTADDGHDHGEEGAMPQGMGVMGKVKEYMARVEANPNDVDALVGLGNSFLMMRAWDRALEPLEKAKNLRSGDTTVLKAIGIAYFNKEDFKTAAENYEEILVIDPSDTLALFNLGIINKHYFKNSDAARRYFEKVLELEKNDGEMIKLAKQELEN